MELCHHSDIDTTDTDVSSTAALELFMKDDDCWKYVQTVRSEYEMILRILMYLKKKRKYLLLLLAGFTYHSYVYVYERAVMTKKSKYTLSRNHNL